MLSFKSKVELFDFTLRMVKSNQQAISTNRSRTIDETYSP